MFPSHSPQQLAIAAQLAQELADYEAGLTRLLASRWDAELYRDLSDRFDHMQALANALPRLAAAWTELLISRVELLHALWTFQTPTRMNGRVVALHERHKAMIARAQGLCRDYAAAARAPAAPSRPDGPLAGWTPR